MGLCVCVGGSLLDRIFEGKLFISYLYHNCNSKILYKYTFASQDNWVKWRLKAQEYSSL